MTVRGLFAISPARPQGGGTSLLRASLTLGICLWAAAPVAADPGVRVRLDGRVQTLPLERYVAGAVAGEVYPDWPAEALKAQAVVARTYALYERARNRGAGHDLESTVISQRFLAGRVAPSIGAAVAATGGEYLSFADAPILAAFHSSSGGQTASSEEVWGEALPYLRSVESPDDGAPDYFWSYQISRSDLALALREAGLAVQPSAAIGPLRRSPSGRVARLEIGGTPLTGRQLRTILGGRALRSALFEVREDGEQVRFLGSGAGHGVGLCQWGSRELALRSQDYRAILQHYYPGARLRRLGGASAALGGGE